MPEARLEDSGVGLAPAGGGWFVLNARDAVWLTWEARGSLCSFESEEHAFPQLGFGLHVLEPGAADRPLPRRVMTVRYPVSELAANDGASVADETTDPDEAYAPLPLGRWARPPCWESLPWVGLNAS